MQVHCIDGGFLQSSGWEGFQKVLKRKTVRIEDDNLSVLMIQHKLPIVGSYFFVPRGPIIKNQNDNAKFKIEEIIKLARQHNAGWVRVEPQSEVDLELIKNVLENRYTIVKSKKNHEPAETLMVDLIKSEEEILAGMKPKTRYNIRLAEKKGVKVFSSREKKYVDIFWNLTEITAKRDGIVSHPKSYYENMLEAIHEDNLKLYLAEYQGEIIASSLVSFCGGVATYLHGASSNNHRNVMAPYLIQWQSMKDAKKIGCTKYDLGGVKISKSLKNSWAGITRFKLGLCPIEGLVEFPGCWDIIIDKKRYYLYKFLQWLKDLKRKI